MQEKGAMDGSAMSTASEGQVGHGQACALRREGVARVSRSDVSRLDAFAVGAVLHGRQE